MFRDSKAKYTTSSQKILHLFYTLQNNYQMSMRSWLIFEKLLELEW